MLSLNSQSAIRILSNFKFQISNFLLAAILVSFACPARAAEPFAVPTFHALGVYWSPEGGADGRAVSVEYRKAGDAEWRKGYPLRYNPIAGTDLDRADYRGSIVNLLPNTKYEVRLRLEGPAPNPAATLTASTWNEEFPIGEVEKIPSGDKPIEITKSGTPDAWRVYDGTGSTLDVKHAANSCITIDASYVILRGITLKGAGLNVPPKSGGYAGAVMINGGHDIVVEKCDISDWGRPAKEPLMPDQGKNMDYGVGTSNKDVTRVIIQRCKIHHPAHDTNNWYEPKRMTHPAGPQCVVFIESAGNHVVRYNEFYSDSEHMYNDILGGGQNASHRGCPGPDTDIYCNVFSHAWDDGIEVEGSDCNVRIWQNYITEVMMGLGNAPVCIGPLYFFRNVAHHSQWHPDGPGGSFVKMGYATAESWMNGHMYFFNNTIFQDGERGFQHGLGGTNRIMRHAVSRNNILHLAGKDGTSISGTLNTPDNDFDYDLYSGKVPEGHEKHGIKGEPIYVKGAGFDAKGKKGNFQLAKDSPGLDAGEVLPNFSDGFKGKGPDMGAHEAGADPLQYGVNAVFNPGR